MEHHATSMVPWRTFCWSPPSTKTTTAASSAAPARRPTRRGMAIGRWWGWGWWPEENMGKLWKNMGKQRENLGKQQNIGHSAGRHGKIMGKTLEHQGKLEDMESSEMFDWQQTGRCI